MIDCINSHWDKKDLVIFWHPILFVILTNWQDIKNAVWTCQDFPLKTPHSYSCHTLEVRVSLDAIM